VLVIFESDYMLEKLSIRQYQLEVRS